MRHRRDAGPAPDVPEPIKADILEKLQQFLTSLDQELAFGDDLSKDGRAQVHEYCRRMGLKSKSTGGGKKRKVTVSRYKSVQPKQNSAPTGAPLELCPDSLLVLEQLYARFPPSEDEFKVAETASGASEAPRRREKSSLSMKPAEVADELAALVKRRQQTPSLQRIVEAAGKLPIAEYRDTITSAVDQNQVVIIAGETGCGKSTQVPQFILDHMWSQSKACRIYCTQPRRISATSVADRVATERGESVGKSVGYQIKLESRGGPHSSLMFCTNGLLLQRLVTSQKTSLDRLEATHIVVDEIHERDCNADFLLIILKDILASHKSLRLVLMSATLDAELFSKYFNGCPILRIPGFTHPVQVYHLEDVLALTGNADVKPVKAKLLEADIDLDNALTCAWLDDEFEPLTNYLAENPAPEVYNYQHSATGASALMVAAGKGRSEDVSLLLSLGADYSLASEDGDTALGWAEKCEQEETAVMIKDYVRDKEKAEADLLGTYNRNADENEVDVVLIYNLLLKLQEAEPGAVLVFLPGWENIAKCRDQLMQSPIFSNANKFLILPLHSVISMQEQKRVFKTPPAGVRKIVLATNIAETSITIDDIVYVIDSGKMKEKSYDPYSNVSTFETAWISKANARQRQGRAGRCQPGVCYRLFSKSRAATFANFQVPEMKRTPLEELCLKVKLLEPQADIRDFLSKALDPPNNVSIENAVMLLQDIGAFNSFEELTDLGKQLGTLPVHPATSKMLMLAILFNCLDPALTIAAAAGYRDPFYLPVSAAERQTAALAKKTFAAAFGGYSDHLGIVAVYDGWQAARSRGQGSRYCSQNYLAPGVLLMLEKMREQLFNELVSKGLVKRQLHSYSLNAANPGILRAILAASMYPMIGKLSPPSTKGQRMAVHVRNSKNVRIHYQSSNFKLTNIRGQDAVNLSNSHLLVFNEIVRSDTYVSIRDSTLIRPYILLFLCNELSVAPLEYREENQANLMDSPETEICVVIDRWLQFKTTSGLAAQIYCLRERLSMALQFKLLRPEENLPEMLAASVFTVSCILSYEGALALEPTESTAQTTPAWTPYISPADEEAPKQRDTRSWNHQTQLSNGRLSNAERKKLRFREYVESRIAGESREQRKVRQAKAQAQAQSSGWE